MIKTNRWIIGLSGYIDTPDKKLTGYSDNTEEIIVISPYGSGYAGSFGVGNEHRTVVTQYLSLSTDSVSDWVETDETFGSVTYQDIADWHVWRVALKDTAKAYVSKFRGGSVYFSFRFGTIGLNDKTVTYKGTFGADNLLPTTGQATGDYYTCEDIYYTQTVDTKNGVALTLGYGMHIYWGSGGYWVKVNENLVQNTASYLQAVDPSFAVSDDVDEDEVNYLMSFESTLADHESRLDQAELDITALEQEDTDMKDGTSEFTILNIGGALLKFNSTQDVVEIEYADGTTGQLNKELWAGVRNEDTSIMLNGEVVAVNGVVGQQMSAVHADPSDEALHFKEIGVVTMTDGIAVNQVGKVTRFGEVNGIPVANFEVTGIAYAENQELFVSTNGKLTNVAPSAPIAHVHAGWVLRIVGSNANIFVDFIKVPHLDHLSDVSITSPATGDILVKNASGVYVNSQRLVTIENNKATNFSVIDDNKYPTVEAVKEQLDLKESLANKGQPNGYAPLGADSVIPSAYVPNSFDDVLEFDTYADLEAYATPTTSKLYIVKADETSGGNHSTYRYSGSVYVRVSDEMSASEVKILYESNADTNAYTDAEKTKLAGLEDGSNYYDKAYIDALQDNNGWEQTDLTPTALTNGQALVTATLQGYDEVRFVCRNTSTNEVDTDVIVGQLLTENTKIIFFDDANVYFLVGATNSTFTENASFELKVFGVTMTQQEAENITYDNATSALTATNVQDAIDEVEGRLETAEGAIDDLEVKDVIHDSRISTIEEQLRKSFSGEDTATASGTDIISLGGDVANAPINVLVEGGLLDAPQLVTNGDFSNGTTGWTLPISVFSIVNGRLYNNNISSGSVFGYQENLWTIPANNKYYLSFNYEHINGIGAGIWFNTESTIYYNTTGFKSLINQRTSDLTRLNILSVNSTSYYLDNLNLFNISTLISNKQYSPIYDTTFDLMSDAQIKAQMDAWVLDGTLPNDIMAVSMDKRIRSVGKNLLDKSKELVGRYLVVGTGADAILPSQNVSPYIKVKPNTTYVKSFNGGLLGGRVAFYDVNKVYIQDSSASSFATNSNTYYIRFDYGNTLTNIQLEIGSTATSYVPYENTDLYLQSGKVGYRLPNLIADFETLKNGKGYFTRRVQRYVLQASDVDTLDTSGTNVDRVYIGYDALVGIDYNGVDDQYGLEMMTTRTTPKNSAVSNYDQILFEWTHYYTAQLRFIIPKGTYATLAEAQADLAGTVIYYQLATPIETEILAIGNAQGTPNGTVYVDDVIWKTDIYTTNITVTTAIDELISITKMNVDGSETQLAVSGATVAGDGLSFTHSSLSSGDAVRFTYIPQGDYFKSNTDIIYYECENDLRFPATMLSQPASGRPDFDTTNIGLLFPQNNTTEAVYIVAQLPHDRVPDSPLEPHIHCRLSGAGQPVMKIDYKIYNPNSATIPSSFTTYTMNVNTATWSSGTISNMIYGSAPISGVGYDDSAIMIMKLYRNDNVYVGDLLVDEFDIHYYQIKKY